MVQSGGSGRELDDNADFIGGRPSLRMERSPSVDFEDMDAAAAQDDFFCVDDEADDGPSGVISYTVRFTDLSLMLEYPPGMPGGDSAEAPVTGHAGVLQTKHALLKCVFDNNADTYTMDLSLGQLAMSKTDAECRTDPALSVSDAVTIRYRALLDPEDCIRLGYAYELDVDVPSLRLVCSPASAPLVPELYLYMFYSFIMPLTSYADSSTPDIAAAPASNFLKATINAARIRALVVSNPARKGSQYFEIAVENVGCSNRISRTTPSEIEDSLASVNEIYTAHITGLEVRHPATDTTFISKMNCNVTQTAHFLKHPYAWVRYDLTASTVQVLLPDMTPSHLSRVIRDHVTAAHARDNAYARLVDSGDVWVSQFRVVLPSVTVSALHKGIRTVSCGISGLDYAQTLEYGHVGRSLKLCEFYIDAPHQHILTRVFHANWKEAGAVKTFLHHESSECGNVILTLNVPQTRATLFADSILTCKSVIDLLTTDAKQDHDRRGGIHLDDIMEEDGDGTVSPRAGETTPPILEPVDTEFITRVTRIMKVSIGKAEVVIPEKNRTDLLLCRFGFEGEASSIFDQEFRVTCKLINCSVSMGHWTHTRLLESESRDADLRVDSLLLLDFHLDVDLHSRRKCRPNGSVTGEPMKTLVTVSIGPIQVVASADQVHLCMDMIDHLADDFGDDNEDQSRSQAVFTADQLNGETGVDDMDTGSIRSATTGRSGGRAKSYNRSVLSRSEFSAGRSDFSDGYTDNRSDSDWQTVESESDHGSYAIGSRRGSSRRSADGSSDGSESEGGFAKSFHSADDDYYGNDASESVSQYSWVQSSVTSASGASDTTSRQGRRKRKPGKAVSAFSFGIIPAHIKVTVSCSTIKMTLTSDPFGQVTPLWLVQLTELAFACRTLPDEIFMMTVVMNAQLKYFNVSVLNWESALEPLPLRIDGNRLRSQWTIDLNSTRNLNFNLSEPLLQALEQATEGRKSGPNSSAVEMAPYKFYNYTGATIRYNIGTDEYTESKPLTLHAGTVADYKVSGGMRNRKDHGDFMPRYIKFRLEGTTSERICIDKIASYMMPLNPLTTAERSADATIGLTSDDAETGGDLGQGSGSQIFVEVSNGEVKGTRKIVFGSSVALRNVTSVEIEVLIEEPVVSSKRAFDETGSYIVTGDQERDVIHVAPGALAYIGMRFTRPASRSTLRVRSVVFGEESKWSNELNFHRSLKNNRTHRRDLVCKYEEEGKAFFCVSAAMVQNDHSLRTIRFHPKLVIENLLPVALDYRFIERDGGRIMAMEMDEEVGKLCGIMIDEKGEVLANEAAADSHHMESFVEWRLQVKIGDHENWSDNVLIAEGVRGLSVVDEAEEPLAIILSGKMENQASLRITVSCPYWIINKTEDELHTRPWLGTTLGLTRRQVDERRRLQEQIKKLYPDHMEPFSCEKAKFSVHVPGFDWSPGMRLNAVGTTDFHLQSVYVDAPPDDDVIDDDVIIGRVDTDLHGDLELGRKNRFTGKKGCHIGVSIQRGSGPLSGTKIFTFTPFFRMDNQTGEDLIIRQRFQESQIVLRADMHAMAFEWADTRSSRRVQVKFAEDDWDWSGGIDIQAYTGEFFVPLSLKRHRHATKMRTRDYIIRGEVKNTEQSTHEAMRMIVFYKEDLKFPPYLILNACQEDLCIRQKETDRVVVVQAGLVRPYACEEPFYPHEIECWLEGAESASMRLIAEASVDIDVSNTTTATAGLSIRKALRVNVDCSGPARHCLCLVFPLPSWLRQCLSLWSSGDTRSSGSDPEHKPQHRVGNPGGADAAVSSRRLRQAGGGHLDVRFASTVWRGETAALSPFKLCYLCPTVSPSWRSPLSVGHCRTQHKLAFCSLTLPCLGCSPSRAWETALVSQEDKESQTRMRDIRRRILIGAKDLALEGGAYGIKKGREMISGFKIAQIVHDDEDALRNDRIVLSLGCRFESVRVSLIGVVDTPGQQTGDGSQDGKQLAQDAAEHIRVDDAGLMQSGRREILLLVLDRVRIKVETDDTQQRAEFCVRYLQIDNQSHKNKFPVLLSIATEDENQDCVIIHVDRAEFNDRIQYFDYAALQVSDLMHFQIEEEWVAATATFLKRWQERVLNVSGGGSGAVAADIDEHHQGGQSGLSVLFGMRGDENHELPQRKNLYFDILRLEPVQIRLDVSTNSGGDDNMLSLPDMNNLRMQFREMQLKSPYGSADHIAKELLQSYRRQFLRKLYRVVGSVLPQAGFLVNFGRGLYETVHMPIQMARRDLDHLRQGHYLKAIRGMGPVQGLVKGIVTLLSNTIVGASETLAWVFGTVATIIARGTFSGLQGCACAVALSKHAEPPGSVKCWPSPGGVTISNSTAQTHSNLFRVFAGSADRDFILRRRNLMRSRPRHIVDGVLLAVLVVMTAIISAVYGMKNAFTERVIATGSMSSFFEALG